MKVIPIRFNLGLNRILQGLTLIVFLSVFNSCQKVNDEPIPSQNLETTPEFNKAAWRADIITDRSGGSVGYIDSVDLVGITYTNGMIDFGSLSHMNSFIEHLDSLVELHNDAFNALYGDLNEDDTDAKEIELNFHEDQPLIDFEDYFQFSSLRKKFETELDTWLQNQGDSLDFDTYPDDLDILGDVERTLVDENGMISIGGVPDDIHMDSWICDLTNNACCTVGTEKEDNYFWYDGRQRNMFLKIKLREWGVSSYCKGRVRAFKRNQSGTNTGGWKKDKVEMRIDLLGRHRDANCLLPSPGFSWSKPKPKNKNEFKKRKKLYVTQWEWGSLMRAVDNDMNVGSRFKNRGNYQDALLLTF